jgi:hypothetical protein
MITSKYTVMNKALVASLFLLLPVAVFAQFWTNRNTPNHQYLISDDNGSEVLNDSVLVDAINKPFSISGWFDLQKYECAGKLIDADDFTVSLAKQSKRYKITISLKDSIVLESERLSITHSDYIEPAQLNTNIVITYQGTNDESGVVCYVNGDRIELNATSNNSITDFVIDTLRIGDSNCSARYYNLITYGRVLTSSEVTTINQGVLSLADNAKNYVFGDSLYKKSGFFDQMYKSWKLESDHIMVSLPIWGDQKDIGQNFQFQSPFSGYFLGPYIMYDETDTCTYIMTAGRGSPGFSREGWLLKFDHNDSTLTVVSRATNEIDGPQRDDHFNHVIALGKDNSIISVREQTHNSKMSVHKSNFPISAVHERIGDIGNGDLMAYPNVFYLGDTLFVMGRKLYDNLQIYKSGDDGETWSEGTEITDLVDGTWNYVRVLNSGDSVTFVLPLRRDQNNSGNYDQLFALRTTDGRNFCNLDQSRCEDISTGAVWDNTELIQHALIDTISDGTSNLFPEFLLYDTLGRLHLHLFDSEEYYKYVQFDGTLTIDSAQVGLPTSVYKGGDNFDVFKHEDNDGKRQFIRYNSSDVFQSIDSPYYIYTVPIDGSDRVDRVVTTQNPKPGHPVVVAATILLDKGREQTGLFLYHYNPWE